MRNVIISFCIVKTAIFAFSSPVGFTSNTSKFNESQSLTKQFEIFYDPLSDSKEGRQIMHDSGAMFCLLLSMLEDQSCHCKSPLLPLLV